MTTTTTTTTTKINDITSVANILSGQVSRFEAMMSDLNIVMTWEPEDGDGDDLYGQIQAAMKAIARAADLMTEAKELAEVLS